MNFINRAYLDFFKWVTTRIFQNMPKTNLENFYTLNKIIEYVINSPLQSQEYEQINNVTLLFTFCVNHINLLRVQHKDKEDNSNNLVYANNELDSIFDDLENTSGDIMKQSLKNFQWIMS